jgi:hypothetical protein
MEYVLKENETPHRWRVQLRGQIDELELAVEALQENLQEAWIGFVQSGDDDESVVTITLKWLDQGMLQMVRGIIDTDHEYVKILYNGGVTENGDRIRT